MLVERTVTNKKSGEVTVGTRMFISSIAYRADGHNAMERLVRGHWVVENNIHWLRDAVLEEDACRARHQNQACALALLRTSLLALVLSGGYRSLTESTEIFRDRKGLAVKLLHCQTLT